MHPCDIYKIARQCGVILRESKDYWPSTHKTRECYCKPTLRAIGQAHGEAHLKTVLMLLTTNDANARVLFADVITAVSELLIASPDLVKRADLVDRFNDIDLYGLRGMAKASGLRIEAWKQMATILTVVLKQERKTA